MLSTEQGQRGDSLASTFFALGDATRLGLVIELSGGETQSISKLSTQFSMTRQAISKHLRVLEAQNLVKSERVGRETQFCLQAQKFDELSQFLNSVSRKWDGALDRLKAHVE